MIKTITRGLLRKNPIIYSHFHSCRNFSSGCGSNSCSTQNSPPEPAAPEPYETLRKDELAKYYSTKYEKRIPGYATTSGTTDYTQRNKEVSDEHFRRPYDSGLLLSSIGLGTYIGAPDEIDDLKMFNGIIDSVESGGVNVIDTAINYRYQKSERTIGAALRYLIDKGYKREELFICSKNGYISEDADRGVSSQFLVSSLIDQGKIKEDDIVGACHCLNPNFLEDQLESTLSNIGLEALDLYYLHNAAEMQLPLIGHPKFIERLADAFKFCEEKVRKGKIGAYGLATWMCFRAKPEEENLYLRLQEVAEIAEKVGGRSHNFKFIQVPVSMVMPESYSFAWQQFKEGDTTHEENLFQVARRLRIGVITSSVLAQGQLAKVNPPRDIFKMSSPSAKHIQFTRSIPAEALLTTLVGQKTKQHIKNNLEVITKPPLDADDWIEFFAPEEEPGSEPGPEQQKKAE